MFIGVDYSGIYGLEAKAIGEKLGLKLRINSMLTSSKKGMEVELEHGSRDSLTNVTSDDLLITGKIALAHLNEFPDYYDRLEKWKKAEEFWGKD